jgi:hypothetical protein
MVGPPRTDSSPVKPACTYQVLGIHLTNAFFRANVIIRILERNIEHTPKSSPLRTPRAATISAPVPRINRSPPIVRVPHRGRQCGLLACFPEDIAKNGANRGYLLPVRLRLVKSAPSRVPGLFVGSKLGLSATGSLLPAPLRTYRSSSAATTSPTSINKNSHCLTRIMADAVSHTSDRSYADHIFAPIPTNRRAL